MRAAKAAGSASNAIRARMTSARMSTSRDALHVDGEAEPVQQLRAQFALFGVHGADQHEAGLVAVRNAVALDVHPAHRRGVEQHVHEWSCSRLTSSTYKTPP